MENLNWTKIFLFFSFIIFLGSLLLRQESAITQDLGRHLRLGEMIIKGGDERECALHSNCLTYTYPDYPFINHHWGSEVIFYLVHKSTGFSGIIVFKAIILGLTFVITLLHSLEFNKGPAFLKRPGLLWLTAVTLVFLSVQMMADRLTTRPEIFGYLFFSLVFFILSRSNIKCYITFYVLPIIILLWVNLHISFIFGLILIWAWSGTMFFKWVTRAGLPVERPHRPIGRTSDRDGERQNPRQTASIATISTLITLLNPSGFHGALMPLSILKDYGYTIVENMTPFFLSTFKPQPEYWIYTTILVITIALFIFSPVRKNPFHLLIFLAFSLFPLIAVRHLPFFALIVPPILTPLLYGVLKERRSSGPYPVLTAGCLILAALTNPIPLAYGKLSPIGLTIDPRHNLAIEFIKQNNLKGQMWNNYDIGSFLEWAIPQHPTFVDGRPEAFPVGFFRQTYIPMQENNEAWDRVADSYDIQWIFAALTDSTPWFSKWWQMIRNHQGWRIVYIDNFSAILIKANGKNNFVEPQGKAKLLETVNLD